jgi:hypothetical protein
VLVTDWEGKGCCLFTAGVVGVWVLGRQQLGSLGRRAFGIQLTFVPSPYLEIESMILLGRLGPGVYGERGLTHTCMSQVDTPKCVCVCVCVCVCASVLGMELFWYGGELAKVLRIY